MNYEKLRQDLLDYFGAAMFGPFPIAIMDVCEVENATDEELLEIANRNKFDVNEYIIEENKNKRWIK